jgi:anhydro-N-acetylmuramic acid kinase
VFLDSILNKDARTVIGLSSGTSMDGMDAALVEIRGHGPQTEAELLAFEMQPYDNRLRDRLRSAAEPGGGSTAEVCRLAAEVAVVASAAAEAVTRKASVSMETVDLIGSHGQTVCHLPEEEPASSLQIGEGAVIAEKTGVTTVSNFRSRDLAAGGQGAPLVPYVDWLLFRSEAESRVMLNVGGIANVTLLPKGLGADAVFGFDTGPGNMVIDGVFRSLSGGRDSFDRDGEAAAEGQVVPVLLDHLLEHPYYRERPPKSTGRETFGESYVHEIVTKARESGISDADLLATVTELTARSIVQALVVCVADFPALGRMIVSGGGVYNRTLMERLAVLMKPVSVVALDEVGLPPDAKEAVAFAVLANEAVHGVPANVPAATGARRRVVLGDITPA